MLFYTDSYALFGGLYIVLILVAFAINIALCVWVYRDAKSRGKDGTLWLIVILVGGCLGLIIYLIVRNE
ncbi:MAG: hypothetical protein K9W44_14235 [Candidatus Lokiarchaeota archaeon]|nr:hypothetical protein [Candidatus Harpocratesius repetitus]